jgi:hypothetical protein
MKHFTQVRSYLPTKTIGVLVHDDFKVHTLELPWLHNKINESCIPEGTYMVHRDKTGRHQYFAIQAVVNRTFIEIHPATTVLDLLGCTGLGMGIDTYLNLLSSKIACDKLVEYVGDNPFTLTITHFNPVSMSAITMR